MPTIIQSKKLGFSTWDKNSMVIMIVIGILAPVAYYKSYKGVGAKLTAFIYEFGNPPGKIIFRLTYMNLEFNILFFYFTEAPHVSEEFISNTRKEIILINVLVLIDTVVFAVGNTMFFIDLVSITTAAVFGIGCVFLKMSIIMPPVSSGKSINL
jgi:hypothetical protein